MNLIKDCLIGENKARSVMNCISFGTLILAFIGILVVSYWMLYPYEPLVINSYSPLPINNKELIVHDNIVYELDYCKNMDLPVTVRRKLVDGLVFALPDVTTAVNEPGCRVQNFAVEVPHSLPEGDYFMTIEFVYKVNPLREVSIITNTEQFVVN